jgi:hypothetical protein
MGACETRVGRFLSFLEIERKNAIPTLTWEYAAELVLIAATTGEETDIERATAQMRFM